MKQAKKLLALLLSLALVFAVSAPAFADEIEIESEITAQDEINWDDFYIISQTPRTVIEYGESCVLSVEVNVPEGAEVTYQWIRWWYEVLPVPEKATMTVSPGDLIYPGKPNFRNSESIAVECKITGYAIGAQHIPENARTISSGNIVVEFTNTVDTRNTWQRILDFILHTLSLSVQLIVGTVVVGFQWAAFWLFAPITVPFSLLIPVAGWLMLFMMIIAPVGGLVIWAGAPYIILRMFLEIFGIYLDL